MFCKSLTAAALSLASLSALVRVAVASPCVTFDSSFNLLVFGLDGKDWNATTQDSWSSTTPASDITASGRPPFDGTNTTCYLSQFFNAVYVMNGDKSSPTSVHIFNPATKSWSTQSVQQSTSFDPSNFKAILDHDTNVFYALSGAELSFLDMQSMTSANSSALSWTDVGKAGIDTTNYNPVMALAQNHIHFLDVPSVPAGEAQIFVIHFSFFQPDAQAYPQSGGQTGFPAQHGQVASFFQSSGVQQEFAFIPDDNSGTFVINVENNSTVQLAAPSTKDTGASYAASITALVQLSSQGAVSFLPYTQGNTQANSAASWAKVANIAAAAPPSSSGSSSATGKGTGTATGTAAGSTKSSGSGSGNSSGAESLRIASSMVVALALGAAAMLV